MPYTLPTEDDVLAVLRGVIDPELGSDIVDLGMARGAVVAPTGAVTVTVALTTAGCPLRAQIQKDVKSRVGSMAGVISVAITWTEMTQQQRTEAMGKARWNAKERAGGTALAPTTKVICVASGKGGVGKSSVTVNLAAALAKRGLNIGVLDADIWGFSVPRMLGVDGRLEGIKGEKRMRPNVRLLPPEQGGGRLEIVSMGFLVDNEDDALMWRGLMLNRAVQHFLEDVVWGQDLDYLLIDMPPGTGDVQMGLARMLPQAEMLIVTTPALAAQKVAARAATMAAKSYLRVCGIVENMSAFVTPSGEVFELFGSGGGQALADDVGTPLLARIPIEAAVSAGGDTGEPIALSGSGPAADAFHQLAERIVTEAVPPVDMAGCSARLLSAFDEALAAADNAS